MPKYGNFSNGIQSSKFIQNGFDDLVGTNIHGEPGACKPNRTLYKASGTIIDKPCYSVVAPNGDTYFFSKTDGDIFKRTQAGVYSEVRTGTNGAYKGACYYRNYIYYTMDAFLGRFDFATTWNDNFQVLTAGAPHPMFQFDLILYVANKQNVASLDDAGVFSSSVLDLPVEHNIQALRSYGDDLITLSNPGDYINDSAIFRWNTFGDSFSLRDNIKEAGVYAFLDADNYVFAICLSGTVYIFNGTQLEDYTKIKNPATTSGHQLTTNLQGKPLVANGGKIYSIYRHNRNFPTVLNCEYVCSQGETAIIHSIIANGSNLLVSWEVTVDETTTYGVDEIHPTNYGNCKIITPRAIKPNSVVVSYLDLPAGTTIGIETKADEDTSWTSHDTMIDSEDSRTIKIEDDLLIKNGCQARVSLNSSTTSFPIIESITLK